VPPDADTVLWALHGLPDSHGRGVRADDVARFMSKDATLSEQFTDGDVAVVLDSLVEEGALVYASEAHAGDIEVMRYRVATGSEALQNTLQDVAAHDDDDGAFSLAVDERYELLLDALGPGSTTEQADGDASLLARIDELEHEREQLIEERESLGRRAQSAEDECVRLTALSDELRTRVTELDRLLDDERASGSRLRELAESTEHQLAESRRESDQLRERLKELDTLLDQERVLSSQRLQTTRQAADALAHARHELERLESSGPVRLPHASTARHRKKFRGNWLE
jgi:hypothetical protein